MAGRRGIERPGSSELGRRIEQPGDDQRPGQLAPTLWAARQQPLEPDAPRRPQRRQHVPVRQRPHDLQPRARRHQRLTAQHRAQQPDLIHRQRAEIGQGALPDAATLAKALAQEDGWWRAAVRDDVNVHGQS
jgi:hypothetical protein